MNSSKSRKRNSVCRSGASIRLSTLNRFAEAYDKRSFLDESLQTHRLHHASHRFVCLISKSTRHSFIQLARCAQFRALFAQRKHRDCQRLQAKRFGRFHIHCKRTGDLQHALLVWFLRLCLHQRAQPRQNRRRKRGHLDVAPERNETVLNAAHHAAFLRLQIENGLFDGFVEQIALFREVQLLTEREGRRDELENVGWSRGESDRIGEN